MINMETMEYLAQYFTTFFDTLEENQHSIRKQTLAILSIIKAN